MHTMVNGKRVLCPPEQERQIREDWARNEEASADEAMRNPRPSPDDPPRDLEAEVTDLQTRLKKFEATRSPLPER